MTDASKTPDHSIPIYGRPLQMGKFYVDRLGSVHGPMTGTGCYCKDQHGDLFYSHGNFLVDQTHDLDLISEYTPPAKVVVFHRVYGGEPSGHPWSSLALAIAANPDADCILELHEVARHPVTPRHPINKGDV